VPNHDEVFMPKLVRAQALLTLLSTIAISATVGCVGSGSGTSGGDGGAGFGGAGSGAIGGSGTGGGGCFPCDLGCFDCGMGCQCMGVDASIFDNDAGGVELPWTVPFANVGDDGTWRSSGDDTLCMGGVSLDALGVWSDERGVYVMGNGQLSERVLLGGGGNNGAAPPLFDAGFGGSGGFGGTGGSGGECFEGQFQCSGRVIYFNDGVSGWRKQHAVAQFLDGAAIRFSGIPLGELALRKVNGSDGAECTLRMIEGATERCDHSGSAVESFFAVSGQLGYASVGTSLLVYDGNTWSVHPLPIPFVPAALWASTTDVVAVGDLGRIARLRDGVWTSQNHSIQQLTSVWGGEGEEIWVGTGASGIMHRDALGVWGESFSLSGVTCSRSDPILGIWGNGGTVYFHTDRALARWDGTRFATLGGWTCGLSDPNIGDNPRAIKNIWGNGPDELFIAVTDATRSAQPSFDVCGNGFAVYFDGTSFHRL